MSRYFSTQIPKTTEFLENEEKNINPFKCRKIIIPKYEEINDALNSHSVVEESQSQCHEYESITEFNRNTLHEKTSNTNQNAFSWKSYSDKITITSEKCDEERCQQINLHNSQNDNISINDKKVNTYVVVIL